MKDFCVVDGLEKEAEFGKGLLNIVVEGRETIAVFLEVFRSMMGHICRPSAHHNISGYDNKIPRRIQNEEKIPV